MSRHFIALLRWVLMGISLSAVAAAMVATFVPNGICPALLLNDLPPPDMPDPWDGWLAKRLAEDHANAR